MTEPSTGGDPIADYIAAGTWQVASQLNGDPRPAAPGVPLVELVAARARSLAHGAVGACSTRDVATAITIAQRILRSEADALIAVDVLVGIILEGLPRGALPPGVVIEPPVARPTGTDQDAADWRLAIDLTTTLLTGFATDDPQLVTEGLAALRGDAALDVLIVLVKAASARIESFVALNGDVIDAYDTFQRQHLDQG
ncbi:hypothetical protein F0L68_20170 [Solihabitans fulvus]|uniref:Uncharacterized protein n=1 Tax=Solihabitans fulvus TaxID=1892852 RepID=A0A5B2XBB6_9PSEU|nr:hypothetical protein [Solihabitans fulvus]KAA2260454.1 hypothetical protein F0L68_20170 [Solihabitans fulvus]